MDAQRFDSLTKTMATGGTRRAFLRGLAAVCALVLPGQRALGAPPDGKGCKRDGINCKRDDQCCSGWCSPYSGTCEVPGGIPFIGECTTSADCDDGDPCTYDVCGDVSKMCFHDPIPDCQRCTGSGSCQHGGSCCDGRCCPAGSICRMDQEKGRETCCDPCGDGYCCDEYHAGAFHARNCVDGCGFCCNGGNGECTTAEDGEVLTASCVLPGISR